MTTVEDILPANPKLDDEEVGENIPETKELFRCDDAPPKEETPAPKGSLKTDKTHDRPTVKAIVAKKETAIKKKSNSGIPRLKSGTKTNTTTTTVPKKGGSYRYQANSPIGPIINKNTLEVQFINNKKRLLQLHTELVDKQRPLLDMHKSLQRTKKQLEDLGKKVVLEDLKIVTLRHEDGMDGAGENPVAETAVNLKQSIGNVLDICLKVCKKCVVNRDHFVKLLENVSKTTENSSIVAELEELKHDSGEVEKSLENTIKENGKKVEELINSWQKSVKMKALSDEVNSKMNEFEDTIAKQQKIISDAEDNLHNATRKFEEKRVSYEKQINELNEKIMKFEEELKKEKKTTSENFMKTRNFRSKIVELEAKNREFDEMNKEITKKLNQAYEQIHKKEVQWLKEKDDFKKNEALLQQKFAEKQNQLDARLQEVDKMFKDVEHQKENLRRNIETQLGMRDHELELVEQEKRQLVEKSAKVEQQLEEMRRRMEEKEREIDALSLKVESLPAVEYQTHENHWQEMQQYKQKLEEVENKLQRQTGQIRKMQSSLKAHAQLAAALKLEKDNAFKYADNLRKILEEARDELEFKNRTIYKMHEKIYVKNKKCETLRAELQELEESGECEKSSKNKCQICRSGGKQKSPPSSMLDTEVGKPSYNSPQYVSESLIGMSVKKVDLLRARLENLKRMKLYTHSFKQADDTISGTRSKNNLHKQIELRGKLYQILQKHADQSCEDFINLLKLTVSNSTKGELKPSNIDEALANPLPSSHIKLTDSLNAFTHSLRPESFNQIYNQFEDDELY